MLSTSVAALETWGQGSILTALLPSEKGEKAASKGQICLSQSSAAARQRPCAGHLETKRKQSMMLIITLPCMELLGQDNNVLLFAWGSRQRFAPSHLLFLNPNLGMKLFVSTAAENQLRKGTAGVRNAGISFEGIHTDHTL